jgi:hypothetical protein
MLKSGLVILSVVVGISDAVIAQVLTPEQLAACKPDFEKYCGSKSPSTERVIGCFMGPISDACKKAMDDSGKKRREESVGPKN